jgi:twitching motility protein PilT
VVQTVERITGVFPADQQRQVVMQVANTLQGVIAQDLIPLADGTGRVLACEVLIPTNAIKKFIRDGEVHKIENALTTGRREGMIPMDACLADLYQRAIISYDAAFSRARDPRVVTGERIVA